MAAQAHTTTAPSQDLPRTARRSLLLGLLAAPLAIAAPTLAARATVAEAPELLALGERLAALGKALLEAVARKDEAEATFERLRPDVPDEIVAQQGDFIAARFGAMETSVRGGEVKYVYGWRQVRAEMILRDLSSGTKGGRRWSRVARLAKAFADAERAALQASGRERCEAEADSLAQEYLDLCKDATACDPRTMVGVLILARVKPVLNVASRTLGLVDETPEELAIGNRLASAVVRIADGETAQ